MRWMLLTRSIRDAVWSSGSVWAGWNERGLSSGCFHRIKTGTVERVGGNGRAKGALAPRRSRSARHQRGGQTGEELGLGTGGGEGQTDAARHFDHASGDLEQLEAQCRELGLARSRSFGMASRTASMSWSEL